MGQATLAAGTGLHDHLTSLATTKVVMGGVVQVKSPGQDNFCCAAAAFGDDGSKHIEEILADKLKLYFNGDYANIPNGTTIIFACAWSPCKFCVAYRIPNFVRAVKAAAKGLTVKYLFLHYYLPELYIKYGNTVMTYGSQTPYDSGYWKTKEEAQEAYEKLSGSFPLNITTTPPVPTTTGGFQSVKKVKRVLYIRPMGASTASEKTVSTWWLNSMGPGLPGLPGLSGLPGLPGFKHG